MSYSQPHSHIPFILKPSLVIANEAIWTLNATKGGIESYPISDYVLHSLFLRLTGAQEQKLKCICWELACRNYDYRYQRYELKHYSECSNYEDKCLVYNDLVNEIKNLDNSFVIDDAFKTDILSNWRTETDHLFQNSLLAKCFPQKYLEYKTLITAIKKNWIMNKRQLFVKKDNISEGEMINTCGLSMLELFTEYVYKERNRCAHNTRSYQHNLPSLNDMKSKEYIIQNYFLFISIIFLLDGIFTKLFKTYLSKLE